MLVRLNRFDYFYFRFDSAQPCVCINKNYFRDKNVFMKKVNKICEISVSVNGFSERLNLGKKINFKLNYSPASNQLYVYYMYVLGELKMIFPFFRFMFSKFHSWLESRWKYGVGDLMALMCFFFRLKPLVPPFHSCCTIILMIRA